MSRLQTLLLSALEALPPKPPPSAAARAKGNYSERMSAALAYALAEELRTLGLADARPAPVGVLGGSGAERRMAGGIGAKKVDVSWSTESSGLLFGMSIKTINFRDSATGNFQKNLTNRRGDMLFEAVTLHRRFPYAVLFGLLCLDAQAEHDETGRRKSTFSNTHPRLRLFTGRNDPAGRDEQFERFFVALVDAESRPASFRLFRIGDPQHEVSADDMIGDCLAIVAERNPDFYQVDAGRLRKAD